MRNPKVRNPKEQGELFEDHFRPNLFLVDFLRFHKTVSCHRYVAESLSRAKLKVRQTLEDSAMSDDHPWGLSKRDYDRCQMSPTRYVHPCAACNNLLIRILVLPLVGAIVSELVALQLE